MLDVKYRVLSEPAEVWWAGFCSDTYRLQQEGWQIAADEDIMRDSIRLLLKHRDMKLYAMTAAERYRFREQYMHPPRLVFQVVQAAPHFQVQRVDRVDFAAFREIDAKPQVLHSPVIKSIEDFRIFATPLVRTEEIIVEPQTVSAMLEQIRKLQAPEQVRIREQQRLAERRDEGVTDAAPQTRFHAQIISLAERRAA